MFQPFLPIFNHLFTNIQPFFYHYLTICQPILTIFLPSPSQRCQHRDNRLYHPDTTPTKMRGTILLPICLLAAAVVADPASADSQGVFELKLTGFANKAGKVRTFLPFLCHIFYHCGNVSTILEPCMAMFSTIEEMYLPFWYHV